MAWTSPIRSAAACSRSSFNYDAIQDIQIKTLGAEAEDGGRTGGFMTIVTKSGSNALHGSAALFVIPDSFNSSNVAGVAPNQRKDVQPDLTLGGPIMRDRVWFFGAYRRVQEDQTLNNAPVPRERRGNQIYVKVTSRAQRRTIGSRRRSSTTRPAPATP